MTERILAGRYELGASLGSGGMARVVAGHDRMLDRPVAVKLLDGARADPSLRERFLREARAAASFSHPNAVAVFDTGEDAEDAFIVMELVDGGTLADELPASGRLDPARAIAIAESVLDALSVAHRSGLVHRDIKPGNILLPAEGGVKLSDFGIAKSLVDADAGLTATGQLLGTPQYLSPEQVAGQPASPRSDLYALGVVLYEMLTGRPPFRADTPLATALAHQRSAPPRLEQKIPGLDPALAAVVHRALEKDPDRRFADAAQMRGALRAVPPTLVSHRPTVALGVRATEAPWRGWWLPAAAVGLVVLALVAAGAARDGRDTPPAPGDDTQVPAEQAPEPAPEPEPPPAPEPDPEPDPDPPEDLPSLIALLAADPAQAGQKGPDLFDKLVKVVRESGRKQREEAEKAVTEVVKWTEAGELDPLVGEWALRILEPLREPPGLRDRDDDDD